MKRLLFLCLFLSTNLFAQVDFNLNYSAINLSGKDVEIDGTSAIGTGGEAVTLYWELVSTPIGSTAQLESEDNKTNIHLDRNGTYTIAVYADTDSGESARTFVSLYAVESNGAIVFGPVTQSVSTLCFLSQGVMGCNEELYNFSLTEVDESYSLVIESNGIDRGILNLNNEQVIHYNDHTGSGDKVVNEVNLQLDNNVSLSLSGELFSESTISILKNTLPTINNTPPQVAALFENDVQLDSTITFNLNATDSDSLFYQILEDGEYGSASVDILGNISYTSGSPTEEVTDTVYVKVIDTGFPSMETITELRFYYGGNLPPVVDGSIFATRTRDYLPADYTVFLTENPYDPDGSISEIEWDFGDGHSRIVDMSVSGQSLNGGTQHFYNFPGTYTVRAIVRDDFGSETIKENVVNIIGTKLPAPRISQDAFSGSAPLIVNFDASQTLFFDGQPDTFHFVFWLWEDGSIQLGPGMFQVSRTFQNAGEHEVLTIFQDAFGGQSTASSKVYVDTPEGNHLTNPVMDLDITVGDAPLTVNFNASSSTDRNMQNTGLSYFWNFSDFSSIEPFSESENVTHTFTKPGGYLVTLTVTDENGNTHSVEKAIAVKNPTNNENRFYVFNKVGNTIFLGIGLSANSGAISPINNIIDWGDGSRELVNPLFMTHNYASEGTYTVALEYSAFDGTTQVYEKEITISSGATFPSFELINNDFNVQIPYVADFNINVLNGASVGEIKWDFQDGTVLFNTNLSESHEYTSNGYFKDIRAVLTNTEGLSSNAVTSIIANSNDEPELNFYMDKCAGQIPFTTSIDFNPSYDPDGIKSAIMVSELGNNFTDSNLTIGREVNTELANAVFQFYIKDNSGDISYTTLPNVNSFSGSVPVGNLLPSISYQTSFNDPAKPLKLTVDLTNSLDPDGSISCYQVDFGNGIILTTGGILNYTLPAEGIYNMQITAVDNWGESSSTSFVLDSANKELKERRIKSTPIKADKRLFNYYNKIQNRLFK